MNKYESPVVKTIEINCEGVLCGSTTGETYNTQKTYGADNGSSSSIWS